MNRLFSLLILFYSLPLVAQDVLPKFTTPIAGVYLQDYYLVNYVDWSVANILDYECGRKTYDGHQGTDFTLRNFAQMDTGVAVLAAANGVVTFIQEGLFDRNKTPVSGGLGNYIAIRHEDDFYTYYGHLKKGSIAVQVGEAVLAGQPIGLVGSSGYSSDPHLHFEVWYDSLFVWDPFSGPCGNPESLWLTPLSYVDTFGVIDHDFTSLVPTLDTLKERLLGQSVFGLADPVVSFWMQGYGVFPGDVSLVKWWTPDGTLWSDFTYEHPSEWWYYYFWSYFNMPPVGQAGVWTVQYFVNGALKVEDTFTVSGNSNTQTADARLEAQVYQNAAGVWVLRGLPDGYSDQIQVVDMLGRTVYSRAIQAFGAETRLPGTESLPAGAYVLFGAQNRLKPLRLGVR